MDRAEVSRALIRRIRSGIERLAGVHLYRGLPHGISPLSDIRRIFPEREFRTVFDVGANVGQSAERFREWFPAARIRCFEPVAATFRELSVRAARLGNVECHRLAFGEEARQAAMITEGYSLTHHIADDLGPDGSARETVSVMRLDEFCASKHVTHIDYLKIDTEGHDLKVIDGARELIERQAIDFVQMEVGFNASTPSNIPFETVLDAMARRDFLLFGIYGQVQRWPDGQVLRRADPVFVARRLCPRV